MYLPIAEMSAYGRKDWTVKARVSTRGRMRTFTGKNGESNHVLSMDLIDKDGSEIRATLWGETAKKHDELLQAGKVFTFSNGMVKVANKKFCSVNHQYELSFDVRAVIEAAADDASIQQIKYTFTELKKVRDMRTPCTVDLCVAVKEMSAPRSVKGGELWMRKCIVVDKSEHSIELAVWDPEHTTEDLTNKVLTLKGANIKEFNGRGASVNFTNMKVDPDLPAVKSLQQWWAAGGKDGHVQPLSSLGMGAPQAGSGAENKEGTLEELTQATEGLQAEQMVFWTATNPVYLSYVRTGATKKDGAVMNLTYDACPDCKKKCIGTECFKCSKTVEPEARIMAGSVKLEDMSGDQWVSMFDEGGRVIFGMTGEEVKKLEQNREQCRNEFGARYFTERFTTRLRAKMESHESKLRVKTSVVKAEKLNVVEHGKKLLQNVQDLYPRSTASQQREFQDLISFLQASEADQVKKTMDGPWMEGFTRLKGVVA